MAIFCRMRLKWQCFLKMSFHSLFEVVSTKSQKKDEDGKIGNYDEETEYLRKRNVFILIRGIFNKMEGAKYPVFCRVSCFCFFLSMTLLLELDRAIVAKTAQDFRFFDNAFDSHSKLSARLLPTSPQST